MKNIIIGVVVVFLLAGCAIVPVGYGRYGVVLNGGYGNGYQGGSTRWVPGFQRWICEGSPPNQKYYWTWEPAHYE